MGLLRTDAPGRRTCQGRAGWTLLDGQGWWEAGGRQRQRRCWMDPELRISTYPEVIDELTVEASVPKCEKEPVSGRRQRAGGGVARNPGRTQPRLRWSSWSPPVTCQPSCRQAMRAPQPALLCSPSSPPLSLILLLDPYLSRSPSLCATAALQSSKVSFSCSCSCNSSSSLCM